MTKRKQFKQDAVNYYYSSGKTLGQAAKNLKIGKSTPGKRVSTANNNNGVVDRRGSGNHTSDADNEKHVIFGGRLAKYQYYDMHQPGNRIAVKKKFGQ